jgi:phage terminase large subunit
MNVNIDLSNLRDVINDSFYPFLSDHSRYEVLYGGGGSGKSKFAAQKILLRILVGMSKNINHKFLCLRKTQPSCRKSVFAELKSLINQWNLTELVKINKSEMYFEFVGGSEILTGGLDDPEKLKSIEGITSVWLEEATELSIDDFRQVDLRLRGHTKSYKQIIITFNPISRLLWLFDEFFAKKKDDSIIHHSTYKDNKFLDAAYIKMLEELENQDPRYHKIYTLGEWGELKAVIYDKYEITNVIPKFKEVIYGLDFGFNDPSTLVRVGYHDNDFYLKELLYHRGLTNSDLIEQLKRKIPKKVRRQRIIYCDNAEPARIEEISRAGFIAKPADKSVKDGIDFCRRNKLYIDSESSNMIKEIQSYKYKEDKDGNVLEDPLKFNDHTCDAFRYALYTHYGKLRPKAKVAFV